MERADRASTRLEVRPRSTLPRSRAKPTRPDAAPPASPFALAVAPSFPPTLTLDPPPNPLPSTPHPSPSARTPSAGCATPRPASRRPIPARERRTRRSSRPSSGSSSATPSRRPAEARPPPPRPLRRLERSTASAAAPPPPLPRARGSRAKATMGPRRGPPRRAVPEKAAEDAAAADDASGRERRPAPPGSNQTTRTRTCAASTQSHPYENSLVGGTPRRAAAAGTRRRRRRISTRDEPDARSAYSAAADFDALTLPDAPEDRFARVGDRFEGVSDNLERHRQRLEQTMRAIEDGGFGEGRNAHAGFEREGMPTAGKTTTGVGLIDVFAKGDAQRAKEEREAERARRAAANKWLSPAPGKARDRGSSRDGGEGKEGGAKGGGRVRGVFGGGVPGVLRGARGGRGRGGEEETRADDARAGGGVRADVAISAEAAKVFCWRLSAASKYCKSLKSGASCCRPVSARDPTRPRRSPARTRARASRSLGSAWHASVAAERVSRLSLRGVVARRRPPRSIRARAARAMPAEPRARRWRAGSRA